MKETCGKGIAFFDFLTSDMHCMVAVCGSGGLLSPTHPQPAVRVAQMVSWLFFWKGKWFLDRTLQYQAEFSTPKARQNLSLDMNCNVSTPQQDTSFDFCKCRSSPGGEGPRWQALASMTSPTRLHLTPNWIALYLRTLLALACWKSSHTWPWIVNGWQSFPGSSMHTEHDPSSAKVRFWSRNQARPPNQTAVQIDSAVLTTHENRQNFEMPPLALQRMYVFVYVSS